MNNIYLCHSILHITVISLFLCNISLSIYTHLFLCDLFSDSESDWSPVHDAAFSGRFLSLQKLLSQGASVNLATLDRVTPLYGACQQGHEACARLLIQNGAYVNSATMDGTTPLSEAYARGHVTCVSLLLQHGAEPQEPGGHSGSPIHRAASKGASVNSSEDGESLLHTAAHVSSPEVASVPVEHRADCSVRN
ncbi:hypothetical protein CRUP_021476 [Coryphaenoides rupestris]|nr:hypothetical protein CRUP_021476 [Coryphaenoides rupestris]